MRIASHRGIGTGERENSLAAFAQALACGASLVELDLRCTLDGCLVLAHNKDLKVWGRPDAWIPRLTRAELLRITGEGDGALATFADFTHRFSGLDTILDIKWRGGMETLRALHRHVRDHLDMDDFVHHTSLLVWLPEHLMAAHQLFPGIRTVDHRSDCARALLWAMAGQQDRRAGERRIVSIPAQLFRWPKLARRIVARLRGPGSTLMAYLPRRAAEVEMARTLGVDLAMTDDFSLTQSQPARP